MRKTLPLQEQQLFELFSNFKYKLPKDPELILYDFYFLTAFGEEIVGRNMNANYAIEEASNDIVQQLHVHMKAAVFYALCAEIRHLFDYYRLNDVKSQIDRDQFEFIQEYYKEYTFFNHIGPAKAEVLELDDLIKATERDRKILTKEDQGGRMASYKAAKAAIKKMNWNKSKFAIFAEDIFNTKGWSSSYGGKPWAAIGLALYKLERAGKKQDKVIWIDHAYDLQHNTDTVFNKLKLYYKDGGYKWIKKALDWKRDVTDLRDFYKKVSTQLKPMVAYISKIKTGKSIISAEDEEEAKRKAALQVTRADIQAAPEITNLSRSPGKKYPFDEGDVVKIKDLSKRIIPDEEVIEWANQQGIELSFGPLDTSDDFTVYAIGEHAKFPGITIVLIRPNGSSKVSIFDVKGIKKKPMLTLGTQMHDPDDDNDFDQSSQFKMNDFVVVTDLDFVKLASTGWASAHSFDISVGEYPEKGPKYKIIAIGFSSNNNTYFYGIARVDMFDKKYVIGQGGLEKFSKTFTSNDNGLFMLSDQVIIDDIGEVYTTATHYADRMGVTIIKGKTPNIDDEYKIVAKDKIDNNIIYAVKSMETFVNFIIGEGGLALSSQTTPTDQKFKFKLGHQVMVMDDGWVYTSNESLAKKLGIDISKGSMPDDDVFKIIAKGLSSSNQVVYGIRSMITFQEYLIAEEGLALSTQPRNENFKFKIDDLVTVIDDGETYTATSVWKQKLNYNIITSAALENESYIIADRMASKQPPSENIYVIHRIGTSDYNIIGERGIELSSQGQTPLTSFIEPNNKDEKYKVGDKVKVIDLEQVSSRVESWMPPVFKINQEGNLPEMYGVYTVSTVHTSFGTQQLNIYNPNTQKYYVIHSYGVNMEEKAPEVFNEPVEEPTMDDLEYTDVSDNSPNWTNVKLKTSDYDMVFNNISQYEWLGAATIFDAKFRLDNAGEGLIVMETGTWKNGTWKNGTWVDGIWESGTWMDGTWMDGIWYSGEILQPDGSFEYSDTPPE